MAGGTNDNGLVLEKLSEQVIGAAIEVHRALGLGLLESTYEACLLYELAERGLSVRQQVQLPVVYKGVRLECGYRLDIAAEGLIVEVKACERLDSIHEAQLLTYLRLTGLPLGLLINFNVTLLKHGIIRRANTRPPSAPSANSAVNSLE